MVSLQSLVFDMIPFKAFCNNFWLNDFVEPGFPHIINGILFTVQKYKENKFSRRALFLAIPFDKDSFSLLSKIFLAT